MFRKLVVRIAGIYNEASLNEVCGEIEMAYQQEKIGWNDREILFALIKKINL